MRYRAKCLINFPSSKERFFSEKIFPILERLDIDWTSTLDTTKRGASKSTYPGKMRGYDILIFIAGDNTNVLSFELGVAIGRGKPIIAIIDDLEFKPPIKTEYTNYIFYENYLEFEARLDTLIDRLLETVIDKASFASVHNRKLIGLFAESKSKDVVSQFLFTGTFIEYIKTLLTDPEVYLVKVFEGSLKSIFSIDLKSWAELLEKLVFFLPELKKRKLDRLKIEYDIKKIEAETNDILISTKIKQAEAFLNIAERYQGLGFKIQIDNDLLILQSQDGQLTFKQPPRIE